MKQLTEEKAIKMAQSGWWKDKSAYQIALFQLQQRRLCMDFSAFHEAVEKALERPVYTHEFANPDLLLQELLGERNMPSLNDILCMIPENNLMVIIE